MMPEIYTHKGFLKFMRDLVTANPDLDTFVRLDLAEIMKLQSSAVPGDPKNVFVLERPEKRTVGDNNSQLHDNRTIAFQILRKTSTGSYAEHDDIYDETEVFGHGFLDQIEEYMDADQELNEPTGDIEHLFRNEVAINQIGPVLGGRHGSRFVFQMITKARPPVD